MTLRVVLSTDIVLSALLLQSGRHRWVRQAWQDGKIKPVICQDTAAELMRILAYPKFRLTPEARHELLADFLPWTETVSVPEKLTDMALAGLADADALVTEDNGLLALRGKFHQPILSAEELKTLLTRP